MKNSKNSGLAKLTPKYEIVRGATLFASKNFNFAVLCNRTTVATKIPIPTVAYTVH